MTALAVKTEAMSWSASAHAAARMAAIALGFSLSISAALDGILSGLILALWLVAGDYREKLLRIRRNPVALAALALFAMTALGLLWSSSPGTMGYFKKYLDLLLVPLLISLMPEERDRQRALIALALGIALTVLLSYGIRLHWLPSTSFITGTADNPTVFKRHITQNLLVAMGVLLFLVLARAAQHSWQRWCWAGLALLAAFNVLFMVRGRTGYVVLPALVLLLSISAYRLRGLVVAVALVTLALIGAYHFSTAFHQRVDEAVSEAHDWRPGVRNSGGVGERLEFYANTLAIVREHPLLGVGTGDFEQAYAEQVRGSDMPVSRNPHNQYLLTLTQTGLVGLAVLIGVFATLWRCAARLPRPGDRLLARATVLTFVLGGLFNSLLMDHSEGLLFSWLAGILYAGLPQAQNRSAHT